jgi:asparagine N-glycosylation enzyme membrane subunit Stt3
MNKKNIIFGISLGACLAINLYLRSFPIYFPQLKTQAKTITEDIIRQYAMRDVQQKFPHYSPSAKDKILESRIKEYRKQNKKELKSQEQKLYGQLKDRFQDASDQTYLMELDCWHWGRYAQNVVLRGRPGDETIAGREWDYYMTAPNGFYLFWEQGLHYFTGFLYKFYSLFRPVEFYTFLFYLPLFFAAIFITVLYICVYRYSGHLGAIFSCLFIGLAPTFLFRSCAGWYDKDILNLLFGVLIVGIYVESFADQSLRRRLLWIGLASFWVGLFCFTWTHWWFIFFIIVIFEMIYLVSLCFMHFYLRKNRLNTIKQHMVSLVCFSAFSLFWVLVIAGGEPIKALYTETLRAAFLTKPLVGSLWPNVFYTVGELRRADIESISQSLGGAWVSVFVSMGMILLTVRALWYKSCPEPKRMAIIILDIWFIAMMFASFSGIRFITFLLIPLGVSSGWLIDDIYKYLKKARNIPGMLLLLVALLIPGFFYLKMSYRSATNIYPLINDTWYRVLNIIKVETPPDAILNSWWDYGDWFKVIARRRVIFDGQTQITPQAYWMAKCILTDDEEQAIAILRMLNNGGNNAFEIINAHIKDPLESILLLETALSNKPENAKEILSNFLPKESTEKVMRLLFSFPATAYFIVEDSMVQKIGAISYLGNWDFSKVYIAQKLKAKEETKLVEHLTKELGKDKGLMQKFYQEAFLISPENLDDWLSNRLQFYTPLADGKKEQDAVFFANGYIYKPKEKIIYSKDGHIPRSLFVFEDNDVKEIVYGNPNVIYSALVSQDANGNYKMIILDRELGKSMFSRLYFFEGKGLKYFEPFINVEEGNNYIRVYNIKWSSGERIN